MGAATPELREALIASFFALGLTADQDRWDVFLQAVAQQSAENPVADAVAQALIPEGVVTARPQVTVIMSGLMVLVEFPSGIRLNFVNVKAGVGLEMTYPQQTTDTVRILGALSKWIVDPDAFARS